jgi:hypothetical protein
MSMTAPAPGSALPASLLEALARAHEGDPDAAEEAFAADAVYRDETESVALSGIDELLEHLSALGGRRERFLVTGVEVAGENVTLEYDLCFQADAEAFAQRGVAELTVVRGRITSWTSRWTEVEIDRSAWR